MLQLGLQCRDESSHEVCAMCGKTILVAAGHQLRTVDRFDAVCADCGGKHAPSLAALVDLARTAERVSRMGRNSVFPPLSALLDLASAAEKYTGAVYSPHRKAG
jgi:hypothetical protein